MRMLVVGCGGVGSWFINEIAEKIGQEQIEFTELISIADSDIVELEQLKYQNFREDEIGRNKAEVLASRYKVFGVDVFKPLGKRITKESQLKGYDFFVLCVDNEGTREMVVKYCHENGKEFIDLRATGRAIFAMPKLRTLEENLKFVDSADTQEYSCQDERDLENGWIQLGNKVVALIGTQMLMNFQRGRGNRTITMLI